ncbi:hypothetical protein LA080_008068 [Diaporthe eres]|nr:hypothetical protein LA080_008068 [Diaporthe eres]
MEVTTKRDAKLAKAELEIYKAKSSDKGGEITAKSEQPHKAEKTNTAELISDEVQQCARPPATTQPSNKTGPQCVLSERRIGKALIWPLVIIAGIILAPRSGPGGGCKRKSKTEQTDHSKGTRDWSVAKWKECMTGAMAEALPDCQATELQAEPHTWLAATVKSNDVYLQLEVLYSMRWGELFRPWFSAPFHWPDYQVNSASLLPATSSDLALNSITPSAQVLRRIDAAMWFYQDGKTTTLVIYRSMQQDSMYEFDSTCWSRIAHQPHIRLGYLKDAACVGSYLMEQASQ